jgi:hypothetical protein
MSPPAYGAWNVQKVVAGTGEALPGPGFAAQGLCIVTDLAA